MFDTPPEDFIKDSYGNDGKELHSTMIGSHLFGAQVQYAHIAQKAVEFGNIVEANNKLKDPIHAIFYCDGGWRPRPDMGGWGTHGYIYTMVEPKQGSGCKALLTKQGYLGKSDDINAVTPMGYFDGCGALLNSTNNAAELEAAIVALTIGLFMAVTTIGIHCDSRYVLQGATERLNKMRQMDFFDSSAQQSIKNADRWRVLSALIAECELKHIPIEWQWVKGHSGNIGNGKADELATRGIILGRNNHFSSDIHFSGAKGYWNPTSDYDRFLNESRWFFQTKQNTVVDDASGLYTYYLGNSAIPDEDRGKPAGDVNYAVVKMKTKDPVLERLETYIQSLRPDKFNEIIVGRLDYIFAPAVYTDLLNNGTVFLMQKQAPLLNLWASDNMPLTRELTPPRRAYECVQHLSTLEILLNRFMNNDLDSSQYVLNDISSVIYEKAEIGPDLKKKRLGKIRSHIDTSLASLTVPLKSVISPDATEVVLSLGIDTPKRNMLAAIASLAPTVYVLTWKESDKAFRYATIVKTEHNVGIWAAVHSNLRIVA